MRNVVKVVLLIAYIGCANANNLQDLFDSGVTEITDISQAEVELDVKDKFEFDAQADDIGYEAETTEDTVADEDIVTSNSFKMFDLTNVGNIRAMWTSEKGEVFAVGDRGLVLKFNGYDFVPMATPTDSDLYGIAGVEDTLIVVGAAGTALKWEDGAWRELKPPTSRNLNGIDLISRDEAYVVGDHGTILHYLKGLWTDESPGVTGDLYGVHASVAGGVHIVGAGGILLEPEGSSWISQQIAGPLSRLRSIWRAPDGKMFAVGSLGTVVMNDGVVWKLQVTNETYSPARDLYGVFGFSSKEVYAVGDRGCILKYDGKKWSLMNISGPYNTFADLRGIGGLISSDGTRTLFSAGLDSAGLEFMGKSWQDRKLGVTSRLNSVAVRGDASAVAVGANGLILVFDKGRFGFVPSGVSAELLAISGDYIVGANGTLLRLEDTHWTSVASGTAEDLMDVWAYGDGAIAVSSGGAILNLKGKDVAISSALVGEPLTTVCVTTSGHIIVAGAGGRMFANWGYGFTKLQSGVIATIRDLWCTAKDSVYAVGDYGVVLICDNIGCKKIHEDPPTFLYGVGSNNGVVLGVGWAGMVVMVAETVTPLASGTYRILRGIGGNTSSPVLHIVGEDGTWMTYEP